MTLLAKATAADNLSRQREAEPKQVILMASPRAIFAYGTLRGDYAPDGDRWGVISTVQREHACECVWHRGKVYGFSLHQNHSLDY